MSPRPRKVTDEEVVGAALRVMARVGPGELSLSEIAGEAGVTAGALVQRFGSKRDVLLKVMSAWGSGTDGMLHGVRTLHAGPLAAVRAYVEHMARMGEEPGALARHFAYLQMDLTDPDFRRHMLRAARTTRSHLRRWLEEAVHAGELARGTDTTRLAALVESMTSGSLMAWAVYREGTAVAWVRRDLEAVLAPYRAAGDGKTPAGADAGGRGDE